MARCPPARGLPGRRRAGIAELSLAGAGATRAAATAAEPRRLKRVAPIEALERVIDIALAEDLGSVGDLTTEATIPPGTQVRAEIRSRVPGRIAGVDVIPLALARFPEPASA
ncbi:MAG: hypothetical protein EPO25_09940, partial [Gammaproteobacteria bacterium]